MKTNQNIYKHLFALLSVAIFFGHLAIPVASAQESKSELPKSKQTTLGLYVTSQEAYEMWVHKPEKVKILDCRTLDEYIFIGHAAMAWNIVAYIQTTEWDADSHRFAMKPNPDFMSQIKEVFAKDDIILVTCRSGDRSARATDQMAAEGYKKVYTITDGFEGDMEKDEGSAFFGKRMVNGWKNSGAPWTYSLDPELIKITN